MSTKSVALTNKGKLTRQKIFDVALNLFNTKGYEQTTLNDICKTAGIGTGTFYHHFTSKKDILIGYVEEENQELIDFYKGLDKKSYLTVLRQIIQWQTDYYLVKGKEFIAHLYSILLLPGDNGPISYSLKEVMDDCLSHGQENGEFVTNQLSRDMAEMLFSLVYYKTTLWSSNCHDVDLKTEMPEQVEKMIQLFIPS